MGCASSRVANEDTVRRCRERRHFMKEAVLSRHHLAAAHSDYLRSLRLTASALSRFASFHSLPVGAPPTFNSAAPKVNRVASFSSVFSSNYAATPSQASSTWDWERFCPPSPPGSDFFDNLDQRRRQLGGDHDCREETAEERDARLLHHLPSEDDESDEEAGRGKDTPWVVRGKRSVTSTSTTASEVGTTSAVGAGCEDEVLARHGDLKEISEALEEWFERAATAGEGMRELLENGREQLDRSFRQLRKTVYHSNSVLSTLSSKWTSKPSLAVKYRLDTAALDDSAGRKSHCSTLERLLAWEKKLYQEAKTRERVKIELEKKLATLQSQECKGKEEAKLDRTKAAIQKLQSLVLVSSQAFSTTSSAIVTVRDDELAPQLVKICNGFLKMWRSMHQCHEVQNRIVQQVRCLEHSLGALQSTSDKHRQATRNLVSAIEHWHSSFTRIIKFNREHVHSLYSWLKLTLINMCGDDEMEKDGCSASHLSSELLSFCDNWKQALDRLPDTVAAEAINSLASVISSISLIQTEELKIKKKVNGYSKELERKSLAVQSIERKYYQSYSIVGVKIPDKGTNDQLIDARDPLQEKKSEIEAMRRKVAEEMAKHTKAIAVTRDMTLNNIRTGLPGVFQAITAFSGVFAGALDGVCHHKGPPK